MLPLVLVARWTYKLNGLIIELVQLRANSNWLEALKVLCGYQSKCLVPLLAAVDLRVLPRTVAADVRRLTLQSTLQLAMCGMWLKKATAQAVTKQS